MQEKKNSTKNEKKIEREKERENNLLCMRKYVERERESCKFIVKWEDKKS